MNYYTIPLRTYSTEEFIVTTLFTLPCYSPKDTILLRQISTFVETNLANDHVSLTDLANAVFLSRSQLFRRVKRATGMSPTIYVRSLRLRKAKLMLQNNDLRVSEAAAAVGFRDLAYFSRSFRKQFGITPSTLKHQFLA